MSQSSPLNTNSIAFIGLCREYCVALEDAAQTSRDDFFAKMVRLLPRLYIMATDLQVSVVDEDDAYIESALDEDYYESVRRAVESVTDRKSVV